MAREAVSIVSVSHGMLAKRGKGRRAGDIRRSEAIHLRIGEVQMDVDADVSELAAR